MIKSALAAGLLISFCVAAQAAPPTSSKTVQGSNKYWLSADLNRLVFWKPPQTTRDGQPAR